MAEIEAWWLSPQNTCPLCHHYPKEAWAVSQPLLPPNSGMCQGLIPPATSFSAPGRSTQMSLGLWGRETQWDSRVTSRGAQLKIREREDGQGPGRKWKVGETAGQGERRGGIGSQGAMVGGSLLRLGQSTWRRETGSLTWCHSQPRPAPQAQPERTCQNPQEAAHHSHAASSLCDSIPGK